MFRSCHDEMELRIVGQSVTRPLAVFPADDGTTRTRARLPDPLEHVVQRGKRGNDSNNCRGNGKARIERAEARAGGNRRHGGTRRGSGWPSAAAGAAAPVRGAAAGRGGRACRGRSPARAPAAGRSAGRQSGKLNRRRRRGLRRQIDADGFLLRLDLSGLLLGRHRATRNRRNILGHNVSNFDSN